MCLLLCVYYTWITLNTNTLASSIDKFCGNGNEMKEIILSFESYQGSIDDEMLFNGKNMPSDKDTVVWLQYLDTDKKVATIGKTDKSNKRITFDPIPTSIGYVCKSDGAMAISIGNSAAQHVIIGFHELWSLEINHRHLMRQKTSNDGILTLTVELYNECQTKCQREITMILNSNDVKGMRYREMDVLTHTAPHKTEFDIGKSCELHSPLRIYKSDQLWNFETVNANKLRWKEGTDKIYDGVTLALTDRSNVCGLLGENDATLLMILGIIAAVLFVILLLYVFVIRKRIFDVDKWMRIQAELNELEREKRGGNIGMHDIGNVMLIRKEFDGDSLVNTFDPGIGYVSVHVGQTVTILERINDEFVKVKVNGIKINGQDVVGVITTDSFV